MAFDRTTNKIIVDAGGSNTHVQYNSSGSLAGSVNLVWDNTNNRLGIGTDEPGQALDVAGSIRATRGTSTEPQLILDNSQGAVGTAARLDLITDSGANDEVRVRFIGDSEGADQAGGRLIIQTNSAGDSLVDRLTITSGGDCQWYEDTGTTPKMTWDASASSLGIGVASPSDMLELSGSSPEIRLTDSDLTSTYSVLSGNGGHVSIQADASNQTGGSRITMEVDGTEHLRITSGGSVGIGESGTPDTRLHVFGTTSAGDQNVIKVGSTASGYGYMGYNSTGSVFWLSPTSATPTAGIAMTSTGVGIGTTAPATGTKLEVAGPIRSSTTSRIEADVLNNGANTANIIHRSGTSTLIGNGNYIYHLDSGLVGIGTDSPGTSIGGVITPSISSVLEIAGTNSALVIDGTASSNVYFADSSATSNSKVVNFNFGDTTDTLLIRTINDSNGVARNIMALEADTGNCGIGTSVPTRPLTVVTGATKLSNTGGVLFTKNYSSGSGAVLLGSDFNVGYIQGTNGNGDTANDLALQTEGGNVGIGATPTAKLDVLLGDDGVVKYKSAAQTLFEFWKEGSTEEARMNIKHGGATKIHLRGNGDSYFNGGNVGIGGTPTTRQLEIHSTGGTGMKLVSENARDFTLMANSVGFSVYDETAGYRLIIDASGLVGIGRTPTTQKLEVEGNGYFSTASGGELTIANSGASGVTLQQTNGPSTNSGTLKLRGGTSISFTTNDIDDRMTITSGGTVALTEVAAAEASVGGRGQIWVKNTTPDNTLWFTDDGGNDKQIDTAEIGIAASDDTTTITTTGDKTTIMIPRKMRVTEVKAMLVEATSSMDFKVDLEYNATDPTGSNPVSIFPSTTYLEVLSTSYYGTQTDFDDLSAGTADFYDMAANSFLVVNVNDVGDGTPKGLKIWLLGYWN